MRVRRALFIAIVALAAAVTRAESQGQPSFAVAFAGASEGWRPRVRVDNLLSDGALIGALSSGLPVRINLRVELWEKRLLDRLVDAQEVSIALVQDPLDASFLLETRSGEERLATLADAQQAVERALRAEMRPSGQGRFYYLGELRVETLSLSDLDELRRWLRGDLGPAIGGERAPERAVASGVQRLLIRVLGLPTRSFEARSGTFILR